MSKNLVKNNVYLEYIRMFEKYIILAKAYYIWNGSLDYMQMSQYL